jgi:hypothetical protein
MQILVFGIFQLGTNGTNGSLIYFENTKTGTIIKVDK